MGETVIRQCAPNQIEPSSMAIIDAEVPNKPFSGLKWLIARRMVHTTADFDLLNHIVFSSGAVEAGMKALEQGCVIYTDTQMARMGIPLRRMTPLGCDVRCLLGDPRGEAMARKNATTRTRASVDLALEEHGLGSGTIYVIGNAPTALIRLVELVHAGKARPALIVGMPVGFVNAAESKEILMAQDRVPFITIRGRKGGSALAACVINQMAHCLLEGCDEA
ncbi:MAG: precorrin-8X methylmutase [Deltaproteobacteria bacterium]|nr:MAG: precorrin-8X methylmutase [Deltaproteobacteria bacterium]